MQLSLFLRTILKLDAASCLILAAALVPAAGALAPLLGVPADILFGAGASLFPLGLFILWLGTRREAAAVFVYVVIAGNVGWALGSFVLAATLPAITPLGVIGVAGQGLAVLLLAVLEWHGARTSHTVRMA